MLRAVGLFNGITDGEIEKLLGCLDAAVLHLCKNGFALLAGDRPEQIGVVLSGQIHIIKEDYEGNRTLVAAIPPGGIFAEALCCAKVAESPVSAVADIDSVVLMLRFTKIIHICPHACAFHSKLIENVLGLISRKNLTLLNRLDIISVKSIRERVLRYLASVGAKKGSETALPFNREELADYLRVERSALSHELSRMKKDGIIDYSRNKFTIL